MSTVARRQQPAVNDPCHCGSGRKYKTCHREADLEEERAHRENSLGGSRHTHPSGLCRTYRTTRRRIPALERPDFRWLLGRMVSEGCAVLHIEDQRDLGPRAEHFIAAVTELHRRGIRLNVVGEPSTEAIASLQSVLDLLCGPGAYVVSPSGERWGYSHQNGWTETDGRAIAWWGSSEGLGAILLEARQRDLRAEGYGVPTTLLRVLAAASLFADLALSAPQIDELVGEIAPARRAPTAVQMALAVNAEVVSQAQHIAHPVHVDALQSDVSALSAIALAFDAAIDAPELAVGSLPVSKEMGEQYTNALRLAAEHPQVRALMACRAAVAQGPLPLNRGDAERLAQALLQADHVLGALDPLDEPDQTTQEPGLSAGLETNEGDPLSSDTRPLHGPVPATAKPQPPLLRVQEMPAHVIQLPLPGHEVSTPPARFDTVTAVDTLSSTADIANSTLEYPGKPVYSATPDPFAVLDEMEAARGGRQRDLEETVQQETQLLDDSQTVVESLEERLQQLKRELDAAKVSARARVEVSSDAQRRLADFVHSDAEQRAEALLGAVAAAAEVLAQVSQQSEERALARGRLLGRSPEVAAAVQAISEYEAMKTTGALGGLGPALRETIETRVFEARALLGTDGAALTAVPEVLVPVAVAAENDGGSMHLFVLAPVPPSGPRTVIDLQVVRGIAAGLKEVVEYVGIRAAAASVSQSPVGPFATLVRVHAPGPVQAAVADVTEALQVLVDAAFGDEDDGVALVRAVVRVLPVTVIDAARNKGADLSQ